MQQSAWARWLCLPALLLALMPVAGSAQRVVLGDPAKGERLYQTQGCATCHATVRARANARAPDLSATGRQRHLLDLAAAIWNHSPAMNARMKQRGVTLPDFSASETTDLLAYLYVIGFADERGDAVQGEKLFAEKGCSTCHAARGPSPRGAPRVAELARFATGAGMVQAMWNHGPLMQERIRQQGLQRATFGPSDVRDLQAFLRRSTSVQAPQGAPGDWREGEQLFSIKGCARCHGVESEKAKLGPDLSRRVLPRTISGLAGLLWNHGMRMRQMMDRYEMPVPSFKGNELADLTAYLSLLGFVGPPGNAASGRALFAEKQCNRCHAVNGQGGAIGPDLARSQAVLSPIEAARLMWQHSPAMQTRLAQQGMTWPQLSGRELSDLLSYLSSIPGTAEGVRTWVK